MAYVIDIETYDPLLTKVGPSVRFGKGALLSVAVLNSGGEFKFHRAGQWSGKFIESNCPVIQPITWDEKDFKQLLSSREAKIFANASYELAWFHGLGLWDSSIHKESLGSDWLNSGRIYDVLIDQALLTGTSGHSLDSCAQDYNLPGKPSDKLTSAILARLYEAGLREEARAIERAGGKRSKGRDVKIQTDFRAWLWVLTKKNDLEGWDLLEEYNFHDVETTLKVWEAQTPLIKAEVHRLESLLIPVLALMESRGVRVDEDRVASLNSQLLSHASQLLEESGKELNFKLDPGLTAETKEFLAKNFTFPKTPTGKPSITSDNLDALDDLRLKKFNEARKLLKLSSTFLGGIRKASRAGRVYPKIYQLGSDEGGTDTGRLSYKVVNLQNQPKVSDEKEGVSASYARQVRRLFIPDEGHYLISADYSSQEPRIQAHLAVLDRVPGWEILHKAYEDDPMTDKHQVVCDLINKAFCDRGSDLRITRKQAKPISLGVPYGSGKKKLAQGIGGPLEVASEIFETYKATFPCDLALLRRKTEEVQVFGQMSTLLGRVRRFDRWEVDWFATQKLFRWSAEELTRVKATTPSLPGTLEKVRSSFPNFVLKRYKAYSGLNTAIQGSAADQTKLGMVRLYYLCGVVPLIQVHDELIFQVRKDALPVLVPQVEMMIRKAMLRALPLHIPVASEYEIYSEGWMTDVLAKGIIHEAGKPIPTQTTGGVPKV